MKPAQMLRGRGRFLGLSVLFHAALIGVILTSSWWPRSAADKDRAVNVVQATVVEANPVEIQRKAEAEARRKAEAEARRKAEEEARRKAEAEARRKAEAEARRKAEEEARRERERQLQAMLEHEEAARRKAQEQRRLDQALASQRVIYEQAIRQKVQRNWRRPSAAGDFRCEVRVRQSPGGEVLEAKVTETCGSAVLDRSVEQAVLRSSPLPAPPDPRLFEQDLIFEFKPGEAS